MDCTYIVNFVDKGLLMCLATSGSANGSTSICPWLWSGEMLPAYWPVCEFDLTFNVLITITAYHLPMYQCVPIAFWILVLSVRFIVPSVVQCYLVHWLDILSIAWPMMRVQRGFVFNIAWNLWGYKKKKKEKPQLSASCTEDRKAGLAGCTKRTVFQPALFCSPMARPVVQFASPLFCGTRHSPACGKFMFFIWQHGLPTCPALRLMLSCSWSFVSI